MSMTTDSHAIPSARLGSLRVDFPVWGLFGRSRLAEVGSVLIIPAPWTTTILYRFIGSHVALPDGKRLTFAGQPGDIWSVLMGFWAMSWFHGIIDRHHLPGYLGLLVVIATAALSVVIFKWFCANLKSSEDDRLSIAFEGGYWAYIGWTILPIVSFVTIVGWAWVLKFMLQWICRNVHASIRFDDHSTGIATLWRTVVFALVSALLVPIPWMLRWYVSWMISQISVVQPEATAAALVDLSRCR